MSFNLSDFGSYYAGGTTTRVADKPLRRVAVTREVTLDFNPNGTFAVEQAYVQFFVPENKNAHPPVVLQHGGGLTGTCWETTPDGRHGWIHGLLNRGYEVHVIDNVERGRAGWIPGHFEGDPILRSIEDAWTLFRLGSKENFDSRTPFDGQQFPVEHLETFARSFCPRWTSTTPLQVSALVSVLERTGPAIVICHSQGGEIGFDAAMIRPDLFASIIALEPSGSPSDIDTLKRIPLTLMHGDHLDKATHGAKQPEHWQNIVQSLNDAAGHAKIVDTARESAPGASHMLMMDRLANDHLDLALQSYLSLV